MCRLRNIFYNMKARCYNKNNPYYAIYGGRGITICDEWLLNINKFILWSKNNDYKDNLTIDRVNNDGNYEPSNCRWVTNEVNNNNRSNSRNFIINGIQMNLADIAREYKIPRETLRRRVAYGFTIEEAIKKDDEKIKFSKLIDRYTKLINTTNGNLKITGVQVNKNAILLEVTCTCGAVKYCKKRVFTENKSCASKECIKKLCKEHHANGSYTRDKNNQRFVKK